MDERVWEGKKKQTNKKNEKRDRISKKRVERKMRNE